MILHYIPKDQLRTHWEFIKHGLQIAINKCNAEWIIEDIYCDCYENRSMAFLALKDNKPYGFTILQPIGNALHIWVSWSFINDEELQNEAMKEIQAIARQGGKTKVTFTSPRRAWDKRAIKMGFKPSTWEYILEK